MKKGVWLLPTLNRINLLKSCMEHLKKAKTSTPGWILVDEADYISKQAEYQALELPDGWKIVQTKSVTMGSKFRELWDQYKDLDWVGILNDDHKTITEHWDKTMLAHLRDHMILGCNDGPSPDRPWMAPQKLCGATLISGKIIRTLGYLMYEGLEQLYIDDMFEMLGGQSGAIQVLMNVCVHHDHVLKGRTKDETFHKVYREGWNDPGHVNGDETRVFNKWKAEQFPTDLQKITALQPKTGLMIATPSHDGNCAFGYALGLTDLATFLNRNSVHFEMARVIGSSLIPHARNTLVDMFLKSKCQRLLFVDSDQVWTKEAAITLFRSNRRIIAGVTPHKRFPINLNFNPLEKDEHYFKDLSNKSSLEFQTYANERMDKTGEIEVKKAGFGFIMVDRSVIELMVPLVQSYQAFDNNNEIKHHEIFAMGAVGGKYLGEDWSFCALAERLKIPMYINVHAQVGHQGTFQWNLGM